MKVHPIIIRMCIVFMAGLAVFGLPGAAASQPISTLRVVPSEVAAATCMETQIAVRVEDVVNLWAYHLEFTFDPGALEVTTVENGSFLQQGFLLTEIDNDAGRFYIANTQIAGPGSEPKSGSGDLAVIKIRARTAGATTPLEFDLDKTALVEAITIHPIEYQAVNGEVTGVECGSTRLFLPLVIR